jgi:hypothetical protein
VGTGIDLMSTYVGASGGAVEALLADERIEALPVADSQSVTWEADTVNPLPQPPTTYSSSSGIVSPDRAR